MAGAGPQRGLVVVCKKRRNAPVALLLEDRAGAVDQPTARLQEGPQRVQQPRLLRRQLVDVALAAQPADVRMAANDARGGARRVQQDGVEGASVPPGARIAGVGG